MIVAVPSHFDQFLRYYRRIDSGLLKQRHPPRRRRLTEGAEPLARLRELCAPTHVFAAAASRTSPRSSWPSPTTSTNHHQNPNVFVCSPSVEHIMSKIAKRKEALNALHEGSSSKVLIHPLQPRGMGRWRIERVRLSGRERRSLEQIVRLQQVEARRYRRADGAFIGATEHPACLPVSMWEPDG